MRYGLFLAIVLTLTAGILLAEDGGRTVSVEFEFVPETSLIVLPVTINDHGPFRFILDTGASNSILSSAVADGLGLPEGRPYRILTAGGDVPARVRVLQTMKVGPAHWDNTEIAVMNVELMKTLHVDGVLGGDYLRRFKLAIDYPNRVVEITV